MKTNKTYIWYIVGVVILIGLGVGIYFIFRNKSDSEAFCNCTNIGLRSCKSVSTGPGLPPCHGSTINPPYSVSKGGWKTVMPYDSWVANQ